MIRKFKMGCLLAAMTMVATAGVAAAEEAGVAAGGTTVYKAASQPAPEAAEFEKPIPVSFALNYTLVSDYVWRGINLSEYAGEGREKPNHQATAGVAYDTGKFGTVGFVAWFEWYAAQERLTPAYDGNNQEIDYTVYWSYVIEPIKTTVETGWIAYTFPPLSRDGHTDYDWYVKLAYDDSALFGTEKSVLNPWVVYYHDLDLAKDTSWWEFGIKHPFAMADLGFGETPVLKDLTLTPSLVLGVDHRYYGTIGITDNPSTRLANLNYGLAIDYDVKSALGLADRFCGSLTVGGFINYSQALADDAINDEFFGGFAVNYGW